MDRSLSESGIRSQDSGLKCFVQSSPFGLYSLFLIPLAKRSILLLHYLNYDAIDTNHVAARNEAVHINDGLIALEAGLE